MKYSALAYLLISAAVSSANPAIEEVEVFRAEQDGYAFYRIPAIVRTSSGTLLAFAEGRRNSRADSGNIDLVLRRSSDGGRTWGPLQLVRDDGENTCGNPAPVVDSSTGRVWLLTTWNRGTDHETMIHDDRSSDTRRVFVTHSDDDGRTFAESTEITSDVKHADWRWYATGPCHAIQTTGGRLVVPGNHTVRRNGKSHTSSHAIFSDDHGKTWKRGKPVGGHTNESTIAELDDGTLYINMRSYRGLNQRAFGTSTDGGKTWSEPLNDPTLIEPVCQASVLRHRMLDGVSIYLFSNPASKKRERMTVRASRDQCKTWNAGRIVHEGPSAYSDLCSLDHETVGLLYEHDGEGQLNRRISFARIPVAWLLDAEPAPAISPAPQVEP